ncbi:DUF397 domain-containing protein [Pseudonocardia sp. DSM 110487]|uniref:DUF397 domain-containing protein n=1 Tax=Pseudonocardia sp. DSM 110487 TaxID=2865833 RepID=UPI001C69C193|nr:DUF397 domain-containing protein [Pseudonocardia sp. DSM 110487]QYN31964.1 DUF397 domain-containing protein [Pseudonocardia sp. DSM 110487]
MTSKDTRRFVKSTFSGGNGGDCVEWAVTSTGVYVRDSKDRDGAELRFTHAEWDDLAAGAATSTSHSSVFVADEGVRMTGEGGELFFTRAEWAAFVAGARAGECRLAVGAA